jgi:hypoxanthine phosphoribosyltransferase
MQEVTIKNKSFEVYKTAGEIAVAVGEIAKKINLDYKDKNPILIVVLGGAFMFAADLLRGLNFLPEIYFVKVASYHGTESSDLKVTLPLNVNIENRDVVIIEDILDTGKTLNYLLEDMLKQNPKSLKTAIFLHKSEMTTYKIVPDYLCFSIPNKFVIGYGLDFDEVGRSLPDLYSLKS